MSSASIRLIVLALLAVAIVAATATAVTAIALAVTYRPDPSGWLAYTPTDEPSASRWADWHGRASVGFLVTTVGVLAGSVWMHLTSTASVARRRTTAVHLAAVVAIGMAILTIVTRSLVEWDQLALWAVTISSDVSGYWYAAFNDDVRFVLLDNTEVAQGEYAAMLLAHLTAPIVGVVALGAAAATLPRGVTRQPDGSGPVDGSPG